MPDNLNPKVFTDAVEPYIQFLNKKFQNKPLCVSDIKDKFGKQYVDLVQEGGGVHGIALAGYTYVLEKMGVGFMKMAGTSAGSINTLLLNAVYTKEEAKALGKDGAYYETRSEKVLEYLANKPLTDMVDGHAMWRKMLLRMFSGTVGMGGLIKTIKSVKRRAVIAVVSFLVLVVCTLGLAFNRSGGTAFQVFKWGAVVAVAAMLLMIAFLIARIIYVRLLWRRSERFGINPGKDFESWIQHDILEKNGIDSVKDLKTKLKVEEEELNYHYETCVPANNQLMASPLTESISGFQDMLNKIKNPKVKIDDLFEHLSEFIDNQKVEFLQSGDGLPLIMNAFEQRLKAEDKGVTKEIVIVGSDITHEIKVEFPGMHKMYWGDDYSISPAKYVRASMSVPFFFKPFQVDFDAKQKDVIEKEWFQFVKVQKKLEPCALLVDGGMLSNFPINVFYNPKIPVPRKPTIGIKLEYEDDTAPRDVKSLMGFCGKLVSTMRFFYDRDFILKHDMYQKTVRSIDTGKIHWLNFNLTDEEKVELFFRGALCATIFLAKHLMNDSEVNELIEKGKSVNLKGAAFSIFHDGPVEFKTEDCLIKNSTFEWQEYKVQRMLDRITKQEQKDTLKEGASLSVQKKEEHPALYAAIQEKM